MTTVWLRSLLPVLAALGVLALGANAASANCDWYVKTALEQQQRNLKLKCGFAGAEWSVDKGAPLACALPSAPMCRGRARRSAKRR